MAYVMIEGYMCERCNYRWATRNGTGYRPPKNKEPRNCPHCKSPYWNKGRKKNLPQDKWATRWTPEPKTATAAT